MTLDFLNGFIVGALVGAAVAGIAVWQVLSRRAPVQPPRGKLGDRLGKNAVPDDRYPLW